MYHPNPVRYPGSFILRFNIFVPFGSDIDNLNDKKNNLWIYRSNRFEAVEQQQLSNLSCIMGKYFERMKACMMQCCRIVKHCFVAFSWALLE